MPRPHNCRRATRASPVHVGSLVFAVQKAYISTFIWRHPMQHPKKIADVIRPQLVSEGAGVKLQRSIATRTLNYLDPFLLLDHFDSDRPEDYLAGFPMHPHRGIETVTYVLNGSVH